MKINTISTIDPSFPEVYRQIPNSPKRLWYLGDIQPGLRAVAIVGTRKVTAYGRTVTTKIAEGLARRGVTIVSGLALGIDAIAHEGALSQGGKTIAVLPCGIDRIYPSSHRQLAERILERGGILTEYEPGLPVMQYRLLERNRLVSGLADALIVTEAAAKSGTMNTVAHALQQGKDVYAVPGNITSPMSSGCNKLIEQGATPIINIDEFIESFAPLATQPKQALLLAKTPEEQVIVDLLQSGIRDGDELLAKSKLKPEVFSTTLTMLELRSVIHPLGANMWSL